MLCINGILCKKLSNDTVGSFAHYNNLALRVFKDTTHPFSCTCELTDVQQLIFQFSSVSCVINDNIIISISILKHISKLLSSIHKCKFIRRSSIVSTFLLIDYDGVTARKEDEASFERSMVFVVFVP